MQTEWKLETTRDSSGASRALSFAVLSRMRAEENKMKKKQKMYMLPPTPWPFSAIFFRTTTLRYNVFGLFWVSVISIADSIRSKHVAVCRLWSLLLIYRQLVTKGRGAHKIILASATRTAAETPCLLTHQAKSQLLFLSLVPTTIYPSYKQEKDSPYPFYRPNIPIQTNLPPISLKPTLPNPTHPSRILPSSVLCTQNCAIGTLARSHARAAAKKKQDSGNAATRLPCLVSHPQLFCCLSTFSVGNKRRVQQKLRHRLPSLWWSIRNNWPLCLLKYDSDQFALELACLAYYTGYAAYERETQFTDCRIYSALVLRIPDESVW